GRSSDQLNRTLLLGFLDQIPQRLHTFWSCGDNDDRLFTQTRCQPDVIKSCQTVRTNVWRIGSQLINPRVVELSTTSRVRLLSRQQFSIATIRPTSSRF